MHSTVTDTKPQAPDLESARAVTSRLRDRLVAAVKGRDDVVELLLIALLADGHVLLEDFPGSGKTTLARALGDAIATDDTAAGIAPFRRVQFTPDLLPSDITGTSVFEVETSDFLFRPGPIFAHVVLADEINRTSPKVQSALLEAMGEKQVTVDNRTRKLDPLFFVIATQNPLDFSGTFPLPSAQLDRFLFKIRMTHIPRAAELEVLASIRTRREQPAPEVDLPRMTRTEILHAREVVEEQIHCAPVIRECLVDIAEVTRTDPRVLSGLSTRALVLMIPALQARALTQRRSHVTDEDVRAIAHYTFVHRLELAPGAGDADALVRELMAGPLDRLARRAAS